MREAVMLDEADIKRFQKLYRIRFGKPIGRNDAHRQLALLVKQMEIVYQPISAMQVTKYVNEDVNNEQAEPKPSS
jgi:hypothetical protein